MAKKSVRYMRLILTGIIWIPVYLDMSDRLLYQLFGFSSLSVADWKKCVRAFMNAEWVIDSGRDWGLLIGMLLFLPLLFLGWFFIYRFRWSVLKPKRTILPKISKPAFQISSVKKVFEPAKLRVQSSAILSVPVTNMPQSGESDGGGFAMPPTVSPTVPPAVSVPPQSPSQPVFEDEDDVQRMLALTAGVQADFFPHVNLDGSYASFALSTEKRAVVVRIINRPESIWAVDTDVPPEESDWFDQTSLLPAPAKDIMSIARNLHDNEPDSTAVPVILLMSGKLLNVDETMNYFEKNNMMLLRLGEAEADEVPLFEDFVKEYFAPRAETTESS